MSSDNYSRRGIYTEKSYAEATGEERDRLSEQRQRQIARAREDVVKKSAAPRPVVDHSFKINPKLVRRTITQPTDGVKRIYVILIDNSGSNRKIADHFRRSSEYLRVNLGLIDPEAQFAFVYFSDHMDRDRYWQAVDFVSPNEDGEGTLISTLDQIVGADGGDAPEAHECALLQACEIDFNQAIERHLIMVSDVTGHDMGMDGDRGCQYQQSWKQSVKLVDKTYQSFELIGCGDNPDVGELQKQFINLCHPELLARNFINLSYIKEPIYRLGIVLNTFLFLVARSRGIQALEAFLARLYEKWLSEPVFKDQTDSKAKEAIARFAQFVPGTPNEVVNLVARVLSVTLKEAEQLIERGAYYI